MVTLIRRFSFLIFGNFFLLYIISRLFEINIQHDLWLYQILVALGIFNGVYYVFTRSKQGIDIAVIIFMIYLLLNGLIINYPHQDFLLYKALIYQWGCIFFYFIGKHSALEIMNILKNMRLPMLFTSICGLYCFLLRPEWYLTMKMSLVNGANQNDIIVMGEAFRLSSLWAHPYYFTYALAIYSPYILYLLFSEKKSNKAFLYIEVSILSICLILAQLRVVIFCVIIFILYNMYVYKRNARTLFFKIIFFSIFALFIGGIIVNFIEVNTLSYIIEHISSLNLNSRLKATAGGIALDTNFGGGFGRYSIAARTVNMFALIDSEYQKILAETGLAGFMLFMIIVLLTIPQLINKKKCYAEKMIIFFYLIAAIGASCLSNPSQYPFIFWFALGSLWKNNKMSYGKNIGYNGCFQLHSKY